jgi:uncharacterized alpha-E superfamily protein
MKITGYGTITPASGPKKKGESASTSSFASLLASSEASEPSSTVSVTDITNTALTNLLALQEISEEDIRRKKLMQQGSNMIEVLERLRNQLLAGNMPAHLMQDLSRQLSVEKQFVADPALNDLIEEIELRLAVEIAKLEVAIQNKAQSDIV